MRCLVNWKTFRSRLSGAGHASPRLAAPTTTGGRQSDDVFLVLLPPSVPLLLLPLLLLRLLAVVVAAAAARHNGVVIILALKRINTLQWTLNVNRSLGNLPANNNNSSSSLTIVTHPFSPMPISLWPSLSLLLRTSFLLGLARCVVTQSSNIFGTSHAKKAKARNALMLSLSHTHAVSRTHAHFAMFKYLSASFKCAPSTT